MYIHSAEEEGEGDNITQYATLHISSAYRKSSHPQPLIGNHLLLNHPGRVFNRFCEYKVHM